MIILFFLTLVSLSGHTRTESRLLPILQQTSCLESSAFVLRKESLLILKLFDRHHIKSETISRWCSLRRNFKWQLPLSDEYERRFLLSLGEEEGVAISLHFTKVKVEEESDDVFNDDLYFYFFLTDGVIPSGKVTSIYKNLDEGDSVHIMPADRVLYPVTGEAKSPRRHLIVDYGIIESDGDDVSELRKISAFILDLLVGIYEIDHPEEKDLLGLRKELKVLGDLLLQRNSDDRLVTSTMSFTAEEIRKMFSVSNYVEFSRRHSRRSVWDSFSYKLYFRMLRQ